LVVKLGGPGREFFELMRPSGFDLDMRGETILVSDSGNARLQRLKLGRSTEEPRRFDPARTMFIRGLGLDDHERLLVEPEGWALDPGTVEPGAIVEDARGRVLVVDTVWRRIVALDASLQARWVLGGFGDEDGRFPDPRRTRRRQGGTSVYVLDAGRRRVQAFDLEGRLRFAWGRPGDRPGEFQAPAGIAIARDGSVYVVDRGANRVQRFDRRGSWRSTWGGTGAAPGQFVKPEAIHVDAGGRVIVIDSGNRRAQAFTGSGRFLWEMSLDPDLLPAAFDLKSKTSSAVAPAPRGGESDCPTGITSNGGRYAVCATITPDPLPLNEPFKMDVSIYEAPRRSRLAQNVILEVDGTMPEHHHGMTLKPSITPIDGPALQDLLPGHGARGNGGSRFAACSSTCRVVGRSIATSPTVP
jgi:DNA-binding beta-propeller fold protein YncE